MKLVIRLILCITTIICCYTYFRSEDETIKNKAWIIGTICSLFMIGLI